MSKRIGGTDDGPIDEAHLDGIPAGAGCTEIWERLSDYRETRRPRHD